ncbi:exopolyphosphatase PRUNE1 isoform X1 [Polypterus senegalus]|uniref:exopolyphosphatase PRUNE1 isoform X1 n=2 Tax=Polypterus senegalus TaxID=55291 RepID=UPI001965265C|nr:exopolyphosphatase PRUNE1 isoform X1 [Polypterus senegalus]
MEKFVRDCSSDLQRSKRSASEIHVVLGNEACDLDSMVSAIALACFLAKTTRKTVIPVLNIPRSEFALRTENTYFLNENQISEDWLIFKNEIDLHELHQSGLLTLTLVDHHVLPRKDQILEEAVVDVIDHRPLERLSSLSCGLTSELVGSCATLITERILKNAPEVLDKKLATLLYGTIVLDCVNMAPEAGKVTFKDTEYISKLEAKFPDLPSRHQLFESLQKAKFNVSGLTTEQMLLKDMKVLSGGNTRLAISVVYLKLEAFLQRPNVCQDLCEFCHKFKYNILVAMTISFNEKNEPFRQIAVYSQSGQLREQLCQTLEKAQNPHLNLSSFRCPPPEIRAYLQGNTLASRKKVLPIIKDFLNNLDCKEGAVCAENGECELEDQGEQFERFDPACSVLYEEEPQSRCSSVLQSRHQVTEDLAVEEDVRLPPTPMNSLVEGCPLDGGLPKLTAEDLLEKFGQIADEEDMEESNLNMRH